MKSLHVFDCDGVLVDSSHRYRTLPNGKIDLDFWRANEHKAYEDSLLPMAAEYKKLLADRQHFVVIATARVMNAQAWAFFKDKLGMPQHIIYRQPHDTRRGAEMKVAGLRKLVSLKQFAQARQNMVVYEDNIDYLKGICDAFGCKGVYVPSNQGH